MLLHNTTSPLLLLARPLALLIFAHCSTSEYELNLVQQSHLPLAGYIRLMVVSRLLSLKSRPPSFFAVHPVDFQRICVNQSHKLVHKGGCPKEDSPLSINLPL